MSNKTGLGLALYAKAQIGRPYWWGTFGQTATPQLLAQKRAQYPGYYTASDFDSQMGQRVHDCVGLIKGYLWSETPESQPIYATTPDVAVSGLYAACTERGDIATMPNTPGVCVFMGDMGHVGVYVGSGMVVEALGHAYGVVTSALGSRPWKKWGMPKWIDYGYRGETPAEPDNKEKPRLEGLPLLKEGAVGETVRAAQFLLNGRGASVGKWGADGEFGPMTKAAVLAYQRRNDLEANGEIGPEVWASLMGVM